MPRSSKGFSIINIMASSIDGKISSYNKESTLERNKIGMLCKEDFIRLRSAVASCDAVFIGARSIECEKGAFRVSDIKKGKKEPEWIIFTRSGKINFSHSFWQQKNIPKSIFFASSFQTTEDPILNVENKDLPFGKINCYYGNISGLLKHLQSKKMKKFALLGGGELNAAFWEQNLVDKLLLTISPFIIGNKNSPQLVSSLHLLTKKLECQKVTQAGNFVFIDYKVYSST